MLRIGTRKSKLALWQTKLVQKLLQEEGQESTLLEIVSEGDKVLDTPLPLMGGKGVFTKALDDALFAGEADLAVHSLKDIPTDMPEGLVVAAILERANWQDALVVRSDKSFLSKEDYVGVIATSSNRRRAQWLNHFAKHNTVDIRGNVQTRIKKLRESNWDATVLAVAGLERLGLNHEIAVYLDWMLPAPGQGAIAIVCRENDSAVRGILSKLNHEETARCVNIERGFLHALNGGCSAPIGALAQVKDGKVYLETVLSRTDGSDEIRLKLEADYAESADLGNQAAKQALVKGAADILNDLPKEKGLH